MRLIPTLILTGLMLAIAACSEPEQTDEIERHPVGEPAETEIESVAPRTETSPDQRRERLREEMARHRQESREPESEALLEQRRTRREQREPTRWWADNALVAELALTQDQLAALDQAAQRHQQIAVEVRSELVQSRRQRAEDDHGLDAGIRDRARERLAEADREWLESVHEILEDDQLEYLAAHHPEAFRPAGIRPRSPESP